MGRLTGKRTLITGGTSGIGLETARLFLAEGAEVAITGRRREALAAAGRELGGEVWLVESDAADVEAQGSLAEQVRMRWGRLDVLYVNAADVTLQPFEAWDPAAFDRVIATNLKGPFFLIQALAPILGKSASIILCGSVSAYAGFPNNTVYAASKAALLSLARTLSRELIDRGVRVNGLVPGATDTTALKKLGPAPEQEAALRDQIENSVPLGRMAHPSELARAALFLASEDSSFVVGSEVVADGGSSNLG